MRKDWNPFQVGEWLAWIFGAIAASAALVGFSYREFETKSHAGEVRAQLEKDADFRWAEAKEQLHRIEAKIGELHDDIDGMRGRSPGRR